MKVFYTNTVFKVVRVRGLLVLGTVPTASPEPRGVRAGPETVSRRNVSASGGHRDRRQKTNKNYERPETLQTRKGQLTGPYIMSLTTLFLCVEQWDQNTLGKRGKKRN